MKEKVNLKSAVITSVTKQSGGLSRSPKAFHNDKRLAFTTMGLMMLLIGITFQVNAYTSCVGGTEITANKYGIVNGVNQDKGGLCSADGKNCNGKTFCMSNNTMNWWSAFNWCESNGGKLADLSTMCPDVPPSHNNVEGACPNLYKVFTGIGSGYGVTSNQSSAAVSRFRCIVVAGTSGIDCGCCGQGYKTSNNYALCE